MTLSALIRKRDTVSIATAIPAISATQRKGGRATVARIATVAVANPEGSETIGLDQELTALISLSAQVWAYDEDDLKLITAEAQRDPEGMRRALLADPVLQDRRQQSFKPRIKAISVQIPY